MVNGIRKPSNTMREFLTRLHTPGKMMQVGEKDKIHFTTGMKDLPGYLTKNTDKNLFFLCGVNSDRGMERARDMDIKERKYIVLDLDIRKEMPNITDEELKRQGLQIAADLESKEWFDDWSYVVFSGNGIHIYYVGDGVPADEYCKAGVVEFFRKFDSLGFYPCDHQCQNHSRILRIPSSYNCKGEPKLVEILARKERKSKFLTIAREIGEKRNKEAEEEIKKRTIQFQTTHENVTINAINSIPIGELVARHFGWEFDGRNFKSPGKSKTKACFVPGGKNFIAQGGSDHIPSDEKGYSPFRFIRKMYNLSDAQTFEWFRNNFQQIKDIDDSARNDWGKKQAPKMEPSFTEKKSNTGNVYTWGADFLDDEIPTFKRGDLSILAAERGGGKTTFCFFIARRNFEKHKHKVVYYSLEQTKSEIFMQNALSHAGITAREFNDETYREDKLYLERIAYLESQKDMEIIGQDLSTLTTIDEIIKNVSSMEKVDLLILDNLSCITMNGGKDINQQQNDIILKLITVARRGNFPVILAHHNRKNADRKKTMFPDLNEIAGSGGIVNLAQNVIQIGRNTGDEDSDPQKSEFHIKMAKHRAIGKPKGRVIYFHEGAFYQKYLGWRNAPLDEPEY